MDFKISVSDKYKLAALVEIAGKDSPETHLQMRIDDILVSYAKQCSYDVETVMAKAAEVSEMQAKIASVK